VIGPILVLCGKPKVRYGFGATIRCYAPHPGPQLPSAAIPNPSQFAA